MSVIETAQNVVLVTQPKLTDTPTSAALSPSWNTLCMPPELTRSCLPPEFTYPSLLGPLTCHGANGGPFLHLENSINAPYSLENRANAYKAPSVLIKAKAKGFISTALLREPSSWLNGTLPSWGAPSTSHQWTQPCRMGQPAGTWAPQWGPEPALLQLSLSPSVNTEQNSDPFYSVKSGSADNALPVSAGPSLGRTPPKYANVMQMTRF